MTNLKKAAITSVLILLLLIGIAIISFANNTGVVTDEAKLRKTASNNSTILEIIPNKEQVEVLNTIDGWYEVRYNRIRGYVQEDYIKLDEETAETNTQEENQVTNEEKADTTISIGDNVIIKEETQLHVRPLINSIEISNIEKDKNVTVMDIMNDWAYIACDTLNGWVRLDNLTTKQAKAVEEAEKQQENSKKIAYISTTQVNFRKEPNNDSEVIDVLAQNAEITIIGDEGKWYKVKYKDQTGYVVKTYVSDKKVTTSRGSVNRKTNSTTTKKSNTKIQVDETTTENINNTKTTPSSSKGQDIVSYAQKFLGSKYVYGGSSPKGFDCSGFTSYVYKNFGVSLPHSASAQTGAGTKVSKQDLQPGDLVFFTNFNTGKGIGHVGIYIGGNKFIHASTPKTGVIISTLAGTYSSRYVTAVRVTK